MLADRGAIRIERRHASGTDGRRGRYAKDGYYGTMEHTAFGAGFQRFVDWDDGAGGLLDRYLQGAGFQGTLSGSPPAGNAVWEGRMVGYQSGLEAGQDPFVRGDARIGVSLSRNAVDIGFTGVTSMDRARALAAFGFEDIPLGSDGSFAGFDEGHVEGGFFGPAHEETAGMFHHNANSITGSFGAVHRE